MRLAHGELQAALVGRREDQVDVVGHQAIGPDLHATPPDLFSEKVAIDLL
ncbi:hypothetical protein [Bradyrhizobium diazoefficiens]|uniref:Uncharacterized protein n=1 Tax=Bradyrhizobium diazoefficiens TaxID=1355477 RepID=A0A809Z9R6_9BRAD|nr:hypothetical protein XF1B_48030 [Bradyrhizobium diazoefficiens]BCE48387.1 hypothetical protein XF4B_47360 [Bradyrhizobium diazoefficiens]BCE91903.1 hypothetical protein XF10B_47010 [Bradyrhizobium diazoefficiens]BCF26831.1 hypothetical protein XF14B_47830 [Bradyrhizobium diazoefficiens]